MRSVVLVGVAAAAVIAGAASVSGETIRGSRDTGASDRQGATATQPGSNIGSQSGIEGRSGTRGHRQELNQPTGEEGGLTGRPPAAERQGTQGRSTARQHREGMDQQTAPRARDEGPVMRGQRDQDMRTGQGAQGRSTARQRGQQMDQQPGAQGRTGPGREEEARGGRGAEGRSALGVSRDQEAQVREYIGGNRAARVDSVDFDVRVGTIVPRTVRFVPLPPRVISLIPRYRGYKYFIVHDEIVIVDPRTLRIVAVLPA